MDEHLITINENTQEVGINATSIEQLNLKMEKLYEKLDEIHMALFQMKGETINKNSFANIMLTNKEQEIFTSVYIQNGDLVDYKKLGRSLGYTEIDIEKIINSLIIKGIPVIKRYIEDNVFVTLDSEFRNLQAKENLIEIKESVLHDVRERI
ncbi:hypothetical protein HOD20_07010 [archaeon]|jgi:hypothetical protein|nr:hypothetical protein [archaeon]MBT4647154.1 hypothetical protein [archaeon]MBT6822157.1 hypothetical protein [archaeon]